MTRSRSTAIASPPTSKNSQGNGRESKHPENRESPDRGIHRMVTALFVCKRLKPQSMQGGPSNSFPNSPPCASETEKIDPLRR